MRYLVLLLLLVGLAAHAQEETSGTTPSGVWYRIAVPAGWQAGGPLVLFQHGFNFSEADGPPSLGPLRDVMLSEGYAVAASAYAQRGWAVFTAIEDNRELVDVFTARFGAPGEIVPFGGSLGGLLALKIAEAPGFPPVRGVYSLCPAAAGSRLWDHALDMRLAYDVVCAGSGRLPQGSEPLPWALDLDDIPSDLDDLGNQVEVLRALIPLNQCTGVNLPEPLRSSGMKQRLAQLMAVAGTDDENFFVTNMAYAIYALSDLVRAPDKLGDRNAMTTRGVTYADPAINAGIARIDADPLAALELRWRSDVRGAIGSAKVLSLHTSDDQLVVPANQDVLRQRLPADQLTSAIVAEQAPTHCGFTEVEGRAGWESLREWMRSERQPRVDDLQALCQTMQVAGVPGECRFDAAATVPALDSVIPPRPVAATPDARYSGLWFDPARAGEGIYLEILDAGRAHLYFYTYPGQGVPGEQAWLNAVGQVVGGGIVFDEVTRPVRTAMAGGGNAFVHQPWGRIQISFDSCDRGHMRWEGPEGWGTGEVPLTRLSALEGLSCESVGTAPPAQTSGAWFDPAFTGSGFLVQQLGNGRSWIGWFDAGANGVQTWAENTIEPGVSPLVLYRRVGTRFGAGFDPQQLIPTPWADVALQVSCGDSGSAQVQVRSGQPTPASQFDLIRLTRPAGLPGCTP